MSAESVIRQFGGVIRQRVISKQVRPLQVIERRTKPINRSLLLAELAVACENLKKAGVREALVSFGWDSNLPVTEMWKGQTVSV